MKKATFNTVQDALQWAESNFTRAELYFGHGTDNAWDDAVAILTHVLDLPYDVDRSVLSRQLTQSEQQQLFELFNRRINERIPVPYLTQQAWFCGLPFYVDERVIIPRSPIAELIQKHFYPWVNEEGVDAILDLCCGSACIAIACAHAFPKAKVDALDLSQDALEVAKLNVKQHTLEKRVAVIESDLFSAVPGKKYDIIVSNPPYVDANDFATRPDEYKHEPDMALASGGDGLDATRVILQQATEHLTEDGVLIVEVGNSAEALQQAFPHLPFTWLEFEQGGDGVFLLRREEVLGA